MLLFLGCDDDNPVAPPNDCAGVSGGSAVINECDLCDADEDGYDDRDIEVLQDFIDLNESLEGYSPLAIGYQQWEGGRLTYFHLSSNGDFLQLTSIPESIGDLSSLEVLNLNSNQLTSIPESIGDLSSLEDLVLNYNQLTSIPESIGDLSSLEALYLEYNQLTSIPESIGNLSSLEYSTFSGNQLTSIPNSICNLPGSCYINVVYNYLCEEYHYYCIDNWSPQDQSDCP